MSRFFFGGGGAQKRCAVKIRGVFEPLRKSGRTAITVGRRGLFLYTRHDVA